MSTTSSNDKITSENVKTFLDKFKDKFNCIGISLMWVEDKDDPCLSAYVFTCDDEEIGYLGLNYCEFNHQISEEVLDISIPLELKITHRIKYKENGEKRIKSSLVFGPTNSFDYDELDTAANILKRLILDYKTAKVDTRKLEAQGDF